MQTKVPYKLLLQSKREGPHINGRSEEQIEILTQLCIHNKIFEYLNLAKNTLRQICDKMTLIWTDNPHVNEIYENQVYLILEGRAYEYLQNTNRVLKSKLNENQDYLMVRKLMTNDFFVVYAPPTKFIDQYDYKKYQLMIDKQSLVGKIAGQTYWKYFLPLIEERFKKVVGFLKRVSMFESLEQVVLYEMSKYMEVTKFQAGTEIINKINKNPYVYFIINGEVEYKVYNDSAAKAYQSINLQLKPIKKIILKEMDAFGVDTFNSSTYQELPMKYVALAKTNCTVYQIDKRILAIVVSSFQNVIQKSNKFYSSVNLNEQIQGQCYKTADMTLLTRNVQKIKTSEKKIRDIKLRFYGTSQRNRMNKIFNETQGEKKQSEYDDFQYLKYQSCQNLTPIKLPRQGSQSPTPQKSNIQIHDDLSNRKLSSIILTAYTNEEERASQMKRAYSTTSEYFKKSKSFNIKRKNENIIKNGGKEESDIIKTYLQKKLKNQMLRKAQLILQRNNQKKIKQSSKIKRLFGSTKSLSNSKKEVKSQTKEIGEQLYERMAKLTDSPLLSLIETERKRMESQSLKLRESVKVKQKQRASVIKNREGDKDKQLILILNN